MKQKQSNNNRLGFVGGSYQRILKWCSVYQLFTQGWDSISWTWWEFMSGHHAHDNPLLLYSEVRPDVGTLLSVCLHRGKALSRINCGWNSCGVAPPALVEIPLDPFSFLWRASINTVSNEGLRKMVKRSVIPLCKYFSKQVFCSVMAYFFLVSPLFWVNILFMFCFRWIRTVYILFWCKDVYISWNVA